MSDGGRRELARRAQTSGDLADEVRSLAVQVREGARSRYELGLAAARGDPAARAALGGGAPEIPLEGLDAAGWGEVGAADGRPGVVVRDSLRTAVAEAQGARTAAIDELTRLLDTPSAVTVLVAPWLVDLAAHPCVPARCRLLRLLRSVALGDLDDRALPRPELALRRELEDLARELAGGGAEKEGWLQHYRWKVEAYRAADRVAERLVSILSEDDLDLVWEVTCLAPFFPAASDVVATPLFDAIERHVVDAFRADAAIALGFVGSQSDAGRDVVIGRLTGLLAAGPYPTRLASAVGLAFAVPSASEFPAAALDVLVGAVDRLEELAPVAAHSRWPRPLRGFAARAVHHLGL